MLHAYSPETLRFRKSKAFLKMSKKWVFNVLKNGAGLVTNIVELHVTYDVFRPINSLLDIFHCFSFKNFFMDNSLEGEFRQTVSV